MLQKCPECGSVEVKLVASFNNGRKGYIKFCSNGHATTI